MSPYTQTGSCAHTHNTLTNLHHRNTTAKHQSITLTQTAHQYRNNIETSSTTLQFTAIFLNQNAFCRLQFKHIITKGFKPLDQLNWWQVH